MPRKPMRNYRDVLYPPETVKFSNENCEDFFKFITDRHNIWINRFVKKLPRDQWTENPILQNTKYTNVYRQLDRGSIWCYQNIITPTIKYHKTRTGSSDFKLMRDLIFKITLYRLANRIETFEEVGIPSTFSKFNFKKFCKFIYKRNEHSPVTTSAHLTCPTPKGLTKAEGYLISVLDLCNKVNDVTKTALKIFSEYESKKYTREIGWEYGQRLHKLLKSSRSVGDFTAYEIYCDLCYSGVIPFTTNDFANIGPGAKEAIRIIYPSTPIKEQYLKVIKLLDTQHKKFKKYGLKFTFYNKHEPVKDSLGLRSIEHSLCEYSKYFLQTRGEGKIRMLYDKDVQGHSCIIDLETGDGLMESNKEIYKRFRKRSKLISNNKFETPVTSNTDELMSALAKIKLKLG